MRRCWKTWSSSLRSTLAGNSRLTMDWRQRDSNPGSRTIRAAITLPHTLPRTGEQFVGAFGVSPQRFALCASGRLHPRLRSAEYRLRSLRLSPPHRRSRVGRPHGRGRHGPPGSCTSNSLRKLRSSGRLRGPRLTADDRSRAATGGQPVPHPHRFSHSMRCPTQTRPPSRARPHGQNRLTARLCSSGPNKCTLRGNEAHCTVGG